MSDTAFVGPRSREMARKLIDAAGEVGLSPKVIKTTNGGYLVPVEVVDYLEAEEDRAVSQVAADILEVVKEAQENAQRAADEAVEERLAAEAKQAEAEKTAAEADPVPAEEKKPARAPRARRGAKASDAGEEKD